MKQVININFHGQVVPIEVSAFDLLKNYTDSLSRFFANEEGKEEIINDIESRIGELFQERLKKGATCITDDDVNAIIRSMGRPEEFEGEEEKVAAGLGAQPGADAAQAPAGHKRLYRDENNKVIGGVCGGLANYFGTDPVLIRVIFAVIALAFGTGLLAYIILWIAVPSTASTEIGGVRKKLFRDPDDKIIAGVCSGIGNYFGISAWIPRALFLIPFITFAFHHDWGMFDFPSFLRLSFSPGSLIVYIIMWLAIPEASSTAEKLEMKGEKVDMNSIKNSVMEEMKGVQKRAEKFAQEASTVATEKGAALGTEIKTVARKGGKSLGDVIIFIVKAFAYFIIGIVGFALVVALFGLAIAAIGLFPLKSFILTDGWQNALAWGTLLFFIAVPVIGVITWIIRRLAKMKANRKILRASFISLWVVGWACFIFLITSVARDFKSVNNAVEQEVVLNSPMVSKLELTTDDRMTRNGYRYNVFRVEPFEGLEEDTAFVRNIEVRIRKAVNDSFRVTMIKMANGRTRRTADTLASLISYNAVQNDSLLVLDKGISINKHDKFRNQRVILTVYVPVGKQIRVDRSVGWGHNVHIGGPWYDEAWEVDWDEDEKGWKENTDYIMKADGLYKLNGEPADEWKREQKLKVDKDGIEIQDGDRQIKVDQNGIRIEEGDNYRYDSRPLDKIDSLQRHLKEEKKRLRDSIKKSIDASKQQLEQLQAGRQHHSGDLTPSSYQMPLFIHL